MAAPKKKAIKKTSRIYARERTVGIGMTKKEALALLSAGRSREWNMYRQAHPDWIPDLSGADLKRVYFAPKNKPAFDLSKANLCGTGLPQWTECYKNGNEEVNLKGAIVDATTYVLDSYDPIAHGAFIVTKSQVTQSRSATSVFISYAWANENVVLAIDRWLRNKGIRTKIDKRDFFAGARIRDEIMRVMIDCTVILIFYSRESKNKPWAEFERELASDLEMSAKQKGQKPPRIIYFVVDDTPLPGVTESNRLAILAKGKQFEMVCEEIYHGILQLPKVTQGVDLAEWDKYIF